MKANYMRQFNRNQRRAKGLIVAVFGLCAMTGANASQSKVDAAVGRLSADGWQVLKRPAADNGGTAQLIAQATTQDTVAAKADVGSVATPRIVAAPAVSPTLAFRLVKGEPLQMQLQQWANVAGWTVAWNVPDGWIVPGDKEYGSDFEAAVQRVVEELASNGADVVGDSWRGNRTIIITQNGVMQ